MPTPQRRLASIIVAIVLVLGACGDDAGDAAAFCNFESEFAAYDGFLSADPAAAASQVAAVRGVLDDGIANAPPDIRPDFEVAAGALSGLIDVFEDSDFGAGDTDQAALQAAFDRLEDPEVAAANSAVEDWFDANCPAG